MPSELISLIGLITENNSSSRNAPQSTLTIAGLTIYYYKKGTHKQKSTVIPLKLRGMIFTVFTKDSLDKTVSLIKHPNISLAQAYVLFSQ